MLSAFRRSPPARASLSGWFPVLVCALLAGALAPACSFMGGGRALAAGTDTYAVFAQRFAAVRSELTPVYHAEVVRAYPHDPHAFTEGLVFDRGRLFESTGLQGRSSLRQVDLQTGRVVKRVLLPPRYFGEGLTDWHGRLLQLTWQSGTGFVYDRENFRVLKRFTYAGQGWGLTHDARSLIMSDGSPVLRFFDPKSLRQTRQVRVRDHGAPIANLNELEYIDGEIFANVWLTDYIAIISPETGEVKAWLDLTALCSRVQQEQPVDVLNGIAYDAVRHRIFVTGKLWPQLFEIKIAQ